MGDKLANVFQNALGYFAVVFVGTWIVEAILGPSKEIEGFSAFQVCLLQWSFFRAFLILFVMYAVYAAAAAAIVHTSNDGSGKTAVIIIGVFLFLKVVTDIRDLLIDDTGAVASSGLTFAVLIFSLQDIAQIIATIHGLNSK